MKKHGKNKMWLFFVLGLIVGIALFELVRYLTF